MMETADAALQPLADAHPHAPYRRRVVLRGRALPLVVEGDTISLQYACGDCILLATHYDYFDGCQHRFYLLRRDGRLMDGLRMPDGFGFLQDVAVVSPVQLAFGYFRSAERWTLTVDPRGHRSLAWADVRLRPPRLWLSRRHLALSR